MKRTILVVTVVALISMPVTVLAQETNEEVLPATMVDMFFEQVAMGEYGMAIDELYASNPWADGITDQLRHLRGQFVGLKDLVGEYLGHELIAEQWMSSRFVYIWHIAYFERQPMQVHFIFYRGKESWTTHSFSYEENLGDIAKELARLQLVNLDLEDEPKPGSAQRTLLSAENIPGAFE